MLRSLSDDLIEATDDRTYWLGPARDTALELRAKIDEWTNDAQHPDSTTDDTDIVPGAEPGDLH